MKRVMIVLILAFQPLLAQDDDLGAAAVESASSAPFAWQNWAFGATLLFTATAGVLATSLDNGSTAH